MEARESNLLARWEFFFVTLDPVHVGDGGTRLGLVDNTIVRSLGVPIVPGTSISGAVKDAMEVTGAESTDLDRLFGTATKGEEGNQGVFRFHDAELILFPVVSAFGPVWITTDERAHALKQSDQPSTFEAADEARKLIPGYGLGAGAPSDKVNLGWILVGLREGWLADANGVRTDVQMIESYKTRTVVVSDSLFQPLVDANLDIRTSVAISDETGAAEKGKLFSYESIPRHCLLRTEVHWVPRGSDSQDPEGDYELLKRGLGALAWFGLGGMVTRGFGRVQFGEGVWLL
jgi:CRISPR-associated protein Cmr4